MSAEAHSEFEILTRRVRANEQTAMEDLWGLLKRTIWWQIAKQLGSGSTEEVEDLFVDSYMTTLKAIQTGALHEPNALVTFARKVATHVVIQEIRKLTIRRRLDKARRAHVESNCLVANVEERIIAHERSIETRSAVSSAIRSLPALDRDILIRFYLRGDSKPAIQQSTGLSDTAFRLRKSRALAKVRYGLAVH